MEEILITSKSLSPKCTTGLIKNFPYNDAFFVNPHLISSIFNIWHS